MAMGRSSMGKQIATAPKSRQPKKMGGGGLAMISPAAALVKSIQSGEPEGLMRLSPLAQALGKRKKPEETAQAATPAPMAKGGTVRGDGCCRNGKTKGKMC